MPKIKSPESLLVGTWRSDRQRTIKQWVYPKRLAAKRRKEFEAIFGKLKVSFTRKKHTSFYEGRTWSCPYRVLWSKEAAEFPEIVLLFKAASGESIQHIIFDSPNSYYLQAGRCLEFFKRVRLSRQRAKKVAKR
jgi:hypothetical protein